MYLPYFAADQTPTLANTGTMGHNPFDAIFRRAIGHSGDPEHPPLAGASISVSTPNTADLLAMIGGAMSNAESETKPTTLATSEKSAVEQPLNILYSLKPTMNNDVRRGPKKFHLSRQNSAALNGEEQPPETINHVQLQPSVPVQPQEQSAEPAKTRAIVKKRTSLSIKLPGNATSPHNDLPSVSSSTDEGAPQPAPGKPNNALLVGNRQLLGPGIQLGDAFLAQFDKRDGVQTPTTAEVINTAIEMQNDGKPHHHQSHPLVLGPHLSNNHPLTNNALSQVNVSPHQRGAHANVNVDASSLGLQSSASNSKAQSRPSNQGQNPSNSALLTTGGQVILLPANLLGAQQSSAPLYILAPPSSMGSTQLLPSNAIMVSSAQQQSSGPSFASAAADNNHLASNNSGNSNVQQRQPSAKEALKRAINQSKPAIDPAADSKQRRLGAGSSAFDQVPIPQRLGDTKPGMLLQNATIDSTTRYAAQQLASHSQPMAVSVGLPPTHNPVFVQANNQAPRAPAPPPPAAPSPADVEIVRRQRFLERNRAAAARCRQRRKHYTETLQTEVNAMKQLASKQSNQIANLRKQIAHLKLLLLAHKDCPVTEEQSRQGLFSALLPTDLESTPAASTPDSHQSVNPVKDDSRLVEHDDDIHNGDASDDDDSECLDSQMNSDSVLSIGDSTAVSAHE